MVFDKEERERRRKRREQSQINAEMTVGLFLVGVALVLLALQQIVHVLTFGWWLFPLLFAWRFQQKKRLHQSLIKNLFQIVLAVTGIELLLFLLWSSVYPSYSLVLPVVALQISVFLGT
jgi:hypothetical protein